MKKWKQNHYNLVPYFSHQNKRLGFHTKSHFIQQLQICQDFELLVRTHSNVIKHGFVTDTFTTNHLINSYVRLHKIQHARKLFEEMSEPNVVSWTSLMSGYTNTGRPQISLSLFRQMCREISVLPNSFTFSSVISACSMLADLETGKKVHTSVEILGFTNDVVVCSSLVDMYGKCNDVDQARRVFDMMDYGCRNVVTWTSMIVVYAQNAQGDAALRLYREFCCLGMDSPNHFMLASVISACASLGSLVSGELSHSASIRRGYDFNDVVASALVDMYAKCGCVHNSDKVFRGIQNPTVISYTSMIVGMAKYGLGESSLVLFKEMLGRKIMPNDVTFVGVLHACSHSGLINEGLQLFKTMYSKHGVIPDVKHHTCVVDMLGRIGRLDEAYHIAKSIHVKDSEGALLWGTLLSASRLHGRVDIAIEASKWLINSNQQVAAAYVTMSNTYALAGKWAQAQGLRTEMKLNGVHKEPGCSWVEFKEHVYVFYAGDVLSCARGEEVMDMLRDLDSRMKERGYVGGSMGLVFVEVEEETKEEIVSLHSERLALGFGLISIPKGVTIRIMKNLRMCRDCHEAFKLISDIMERDFVVRDVNRFHHFENGSCSCRDFW